MKHLATITAENLFHGYCAKPGLVHPVQVEIEGVLSGGFIVIKGEENFDRVVAILREHAVKSVTMNGVAS